MQGTRQLLPEVTAAKMSHHDKPIRETLDIEGPAGRLEALLESPPGDDFRRAAVICHPHPLHQGTMQNKVVHTLARAMMELGAPALRFNFRGVGKSGGQHAEGVGEVGDAVAACNWMRERHPAAELLLAGFSFGAMVACAAAVTVRPVQVVTVAPPVERTRSLLAGRHPGVPWLVVQGDADGVVPCAGVTAWVRELSPAPRLVVLPGVDHFFHGNLTRLRETVVDHLSTDDR